MGFEVSAKCDWCGNKVYWKNLSIGKTRVTKLLREDGWSIGKDWICPFCKEKYKEFKRKMRKNNERV